MSHHLSPRTRRAIGLIVLLVLASAAWTQEAAPRRYGLFVGANDGGRERAILRWAVSDARRVADVMTEIGGILPQDAYLLSNPETRDLELQLEHVARRVAADRPGVRRAEFVFYYSGHSDETGVMLGSDHLSYADLRRAIDAIGADVTIAILDSCASGAFTRLKGGEFTQPLMLDRGSDVTGHAFLASSSADEASQESDALGASFFTHYLVSGLRGAADTSGDKLVTLDEAYRYAREETLRRTLNTFAGPQNASFDFQLSGTGSLVLTSLEVVDAALLFDPSLAGQLYISRRTGGLVAEVLKRAGANLTMALPAGSYVLTLQGEGRNYQHEVDLRSGARVPVASRDFRVTFLDRNRIRGDEPAVEPLSVTVLPGIPLVGDDPFSVTFSLGLIVGQAYRVQGLQASSVLSLAAENVTGVQVAGVGGVVGGDLVGFQQSGVFNIVRGNSAALQNAGVFNIVDGEGRLVQSAGVFNVATGGFTGAQVAGVFNSTDGTLRGAQVAGVLNRAGAANGAQVSLVNIGGDVNGAQVGLVNIGGRVSGAQVGLVNFSRELYGVPIGLVNYVERGIHNVNLWWEGEERTWIGLQNGSNIVYTLAYAGVTRGGSWRELEGFGAGAGLGFRVQSRPFYFDVDAGWKRISLGDDAQQRFRSLWDSGVGASFANARIVSGIAIGDGLGWFMGGSFDIEGPSTIDRIGYFSNPEDAIVVGSTEWGTVRIYATLFTGFKF